MLLSARLELPLQLGVLRHLNHRRGTPLRRPALRPESLNQLPFARKLAPPRQHEGMNVQRIGYILDSGTRGVGQPNRRPLELQRVLADLLGSLSGWHWTPLVVSPRCLLYRVK